MRYVLLNNQGDPTGDVILATPEFMQLHHPQGSFREEEQLPEPSPESPVWTWYIDIGPFTDRLGMASAAIDLSTVPGVVVIRNDLARRKWIDLKDQRVIAALWYLAGQPHPALGTLAQPLLTPEVVNAALSTPVSAEENLALRKLYFGA